MVLGTAGLTIPEVEVAEKPVRRRFSAEYKRKVLKETDACVRPGGLGALLRREGLYSSHLTTWRAARERGEIAGLAQSRSFVFPHPRRSWITLPRFLVNTHALGLFLCSASYPTGRPSA